MVFKSSGGAVASPPNSLVASFLCRFGLLTSAFFQIDAHAGSVNDLAFAYPNKQLCVVTCGDDKLIKVL